MLVGSGCSHGDQQEPGRDRRYCRTLSLAVPPSSRSKFVCGVGRPEQLTRGAYFFEVSDLVHKPVTWLRAGTSFVAVDRNVFIEVEEGADLPVVSGVIAATMPQICTTVEDRLAGSKLPLCAERRS